MEYARLASVILASAALLACDLANSRRAFGEVNTIVVVAADSLWAEVGDSVRQSLERRVFTTRSERTLRIEHISPLDAGWSRLRRFVQVLAIGVADDGWIAPILDAPPTRLPAIAQRDNVWAQGQSVTALVVPADGAAAGVLALADSLGRRYDASFRAYATAHMFASGRASALRDSLLANAGFGITLPRVYHAVARSDTVRIFRSESQAGGILFRTIAITSRADAAVPDAVQLLAWRDRLAAEYYTNPAHLTRRDTMLLDTLAGGALEVQGVWRSADASYPEAGLFVTRAVPCAAQDRLYLLDAWLLAPGRAKYQYLIQFRTIFDSFECAGAQR